MRWGMGSKAPFPKSLLGEPHLRLAHRHRADSPERPCYRSGMIRWLILIPFALLIAIGMSSAFFRIASMVDPLMAALTGETLFVGFWNLVDAVFSSEDPGPIVADAMLAVGRIVFTLLVLPPLVIAVISEVLRMRSLVWYAVATGVLTASV